MTEPLLRLDKINTFYGAVQAHFDLSLEVGAGRIVCLLGGNASGKSTAMKVILGLVSPRSGTVTLDGKRINGLPTHQIIRAGVGSVPERLDQRAGTLSGGEQQMVAMARALMGRPRLICMDEPTMGLSPLFVDRVLELIAEINRQGVTVFMVEQNANLALQIAHEGYVLQTGRIVLQGSAETLRNDPRIREAYLGGALAA
jgi:branched-chain amino acid transport system ATP-binding protein